MKSDADSNNGNSRSLPDRIVRLSVLIVLGWFTLLIKLISGITILMLNLIGKLISREKKKD